MTTVRVKCPGCGREYDVASSFVGKKGRCKKCNAKFVLQQSDVALADSTPAADQNPEETQRASTESTANVPQESRSLATEDGVPGEWQVGDVILDLYEVRRVFESGGMGLVYQVHHKGWNLPLAVKSPRASFFETEQDKQNFEREAETWVNLGLHPHIVSCHYVRRLGGIPRVFAEYMEGGSLKDWIEDGRLYEGGSDVVLQRMLDIAIQFAWGLHYAHEQKLIHQDVKPANVLMTTDGIAKVSDFGLAKAQGVNRDAAPNRPGASILVSSGGMTPAYCSPEQASRQPLSRRTDLWSWAVSVLEMFTGDITWYSGSAAGEALEGYLDAGGSGDDRIPLMPQGVVELLRNCFQREPGARPRDFEEVAGTLQAAYAQCRGSAYSRPQPQANDLLADGLNNRGVSLLDLGKQQEAKLTFERALQADPHHPQSTYNLGLVQWRSGWITDEEVVRRIEEVRHSHPNSTIDELLLAQVHLERDDCESAIKLLESIQGSTENREEIASVLQQARARTPHSARLLRTFEGHTSNVICVVISPDGRRGLSGSFDKTLKLWDLATGECLRTFEGHTEGVQSVVFSPDGRWGLSGSWDHTLKLWDLASGECLRTFKGHTGIVKSVAISPDGRWGLSGSWDSTLRLWDLESGECLRTFEGHTSPVNSVSISPDGRWGLSGSDDKTLKLWELAKGECVREFAGHSSHVNSVTISPDGRRGLSGSGGTLRLWDLVSGECLRTFKGHTNIINSVAISSDGRWGLSGSLDNTLQLWDLATGHFIAKLFGPTARGPTSVSVAISPG